MGKIFKQKYFKYFVKALVAIVLVVLFISPIIGVIVGNNVPYLQFFDHPHTFFGLDNLENFFTFWITLFGVIGLAFNFYYTQKSIRLQEKTQRDDRFARGVELLGNTSESARTGAAYNLFFLAKEFPEEYSKPVFEILCSHIRTKTNEEEYQSKYKYSCSNEIQTTIDLLFKNHKDKHPFLGYKANLRKSLLVGCDFINAHLVEANLERANLQEAYLSYTHLERANLQRADLFYASLSRAHLEGANLQGVNLERADLEGVKLDKIVNLDKALNLDEALNVDRDSFPEYMKSK